jgi:hypothetical protein
MSFVREANAEPIPGYRLIEPLEATKHLVEVPERFAAVPADLSLHRLEAPIDPVEPTGHGPELLVDGFEAMPEELEEIQILARQHGGPLRRQATLDLELMVRVHPWQPGRCTTQTPYQEYREVLLGRDNKEVS